MVRLESKVDRLTELVTENRWEHPERDPEDDFAFYEPTIHDEESTVMESSFGEQSEQSSTSKVDNSGESIQSTVGSSSNEIHEAVLINDNIVQLRHQSSSVTSFAVKLVKEMFQPGELIGKNVSGVRGKEPLNPGKIGKLKEIVCQFYPAPTAEAIEIWRSCRKAIDSYLRKTYKAS